MERPKYRTILFANTGAERCGVYQFGKNMYTSLTVRHGVRMNSLPHVMYHQGFNNVGDFLNEVANPSRKYDAVVVNWHTAAMPWMTNDALKQVRESGKKVILIPHDEIVAFDQIDAIMYIDPSMDESALAKGSYIIGRPLLPTPAISDRPYISDVPVVGFAGFAFDHKHIERIVDIIKDEGPDFDCVVRLHLPPSDFGYNPSYIQSIKSHFVQNLPGKPVILTQKFLTPLEFLKFLWTNDINIFPYEDKRVVNRGISSITDMAIAAMRPFMISESNMFRHFAPEDREKMTIGKVKISQMLTPGYNDFIAKYWHRWSPSENKLIFDKIIRETCV